MASARFFAAVLLACALTLVVAGRRVGFQVGLPVGGDCECLRGSHTPGSTTDFAALWA